MRLVLTFPFVAPGDVMNSDYLGQVARVEELENGRFGRAWLEELDRRLSGAFALPIVAAGPSQCGDA